MAKTSDLKTSSEQKPPIYLLDSMAFIFRAYHAMQRQRPMSTRTGIPTAATYVFVNMINKLRKDFSPHYLAAVYDLSGPVFRDERAREMKAVKKFNIKTQQFDEIDYLGYKANRTEMPADLTQQLPFIRRALDAFRIPILSYEGFEADDVIGTLSCKLSALGHKVYVVSSDKDMMQLVNDDVVILNPTKDNLILDRAGVEANLGVPPERVIDVAGLPVSGALVVATGAMEISVHGWDVYVACGHGRPIPPGLAAPLIELSPLLVTDRDGLFACPVAVPPDACPGDRLVAFLGRV